LRDALDDAALARGIAALEQHDDLELLVDDPILQLDQLALQPKQLLEIEFPLQRLMFGMVGDAPQNTGDALVVDLQLHFFVHVVDDFIVEALEERARFGCFVLVHGGAFPSSPVRRPRSLACDAAIGML
jgi:hypothetical protein